MENASLAFRVDGINVIYASKGQGLVLRTKQAKWLAEYN